MEMTFAMIKPNAVKSGLVGRIIDRYISAGLSVCAVKMHQMTSEDARGFYAEHVEKPFFGELEAYMTKGPSVMLALINGATNPAKAEPGTLRYDFAPSMTENVVHSSDSPESAARELDFWFTKEERYAYEMPSLKACCVL